MNWKKSLIYGSLAAGAILLLTGRRPAGFVVAGIGVATLIAEHPEKFEDLWHHMPEYIDKGGRLLDRAAGLIELLGQERGPGLRNIANR